MNPHRTLALGLAITCFAAAGIVLLAGLFFTFAFISQVDPAEAGLKGVTSRQMVGLGSGLVLFVAVVVAAFGWRVRSVFGRRHRQEKLAWRSVAGCLGLSSMGCGLWVALATAFALVTGRLITDLEIGKRVDSMPITPGEVASVAWPGVVVCLLLAGGAWFVRSQLARLKPEDRARLLQAYKDAVRPYLHGMAEPRARAFVQEQTEELLTKLDAPFKAELLVFLSESGLLKADAGVSLRGADFRGVNLTATSLPRADLRGIDLGGAVLRRAFLFGADLRWANLRDADLRDADLEGASLTHADLTGAVLDGANLSPHDEGTKGNGAS